MDPDILKKRAKAIYDVDAQAPRRRSYENEDVQALYASELGAPNFPAAHRLLHTHYSARHSKRALLMRFLDCVDRRDGAEAARLFHPDGVWSTASAFGEITGAEAIRAVIENTLPPRRYGPGYARHQIEAALDCDDLAVLAPDGSNCRFDIEIARTEGGQSSRAVIMNLSRIVC